MPNEAYSAGQNIGAVLGDLLGGGGREPGKAYYQQLKSNYETQKLMEEAKAQRAMNLGRSGVTADAFASAYPGMKPELAALLAAAAQSQRAMNFNTLGATPHDMQMLDMRQQAQQALTPTLGEGQATLAAMQGKPVDMVDVKGNTLYEPLAPLGEQDPQITPYGKAAVDAGVEKANISARAGVKKANISAAARGGKGGSNGTTSRPPSNASVEAQELSNARAALQANVPRSAVEGEMKRRGFTHLIKKI